MIDVVSIDIFRPRGTTWPMRKSKIISAVGVPGLKSPFPDVAGLYMRPLICTSKKCEQLVL